MQRRPARIAAHIVALVLVFVVGVLFGQQFCGEEPQEVPDDDCPEASTHFVEYCPPEDEQTEDEPIDVAPQPREVDESTDTLPDSPPPADPEQRRRLLGWARDQSSTLQGCPRDLGNTHRLGVTIELDDDEVIDVSINTDGDELPPSFRSCLIERIGQWTLPDDIDSVERNLFFHLTL